MKNRRYSGNDKHFWPFTFSIDKDSGWSPWGVMLDSGSNHDEEHTGCHLSFYLGKYTLHIELPALIRDFRIKHLAVSWDAETIARLGRNYYYESFPREYGFRLTNKFSDLHLHYGPQTHSSDTSKSKVIFLPWMNWRFIRTSYYGLNLEHIRTIPDRTPYHEYSGFVDSLPTRNFRFLDFDGQELIASTKIEEREWRLGTGCFRWLSWFAKPKIHRSLNILFSDECGPEKGSWKGGTLGTGIDMLPGESHESAFKRYCENEHRSKYRNYRVSYIGQVQP